MKDFAEQHEQLGELVSKLVAELARTLPAKPVTSKATPANTFELFDEPFPETGIPIQQIVKRYENDVAPHAMQVPSPRYFGQFNPTPLPISVWSDVLISFLNQNAGAWR